jgi:hypothetical protein
MITMIQGLSGEAHRLACKQVVNPELIRKAQSLIKEAREVLEEQAK